MEVFTRSGKWPWEEAAAVRQPQRRRVRPSSHVRRRPAHAELLEVVDPILCEVALLVVAEGDDHRVVHRVHPHERLDTALAVAASAGRWPFGHRRWVGDRLGLVRLHRLGLAACLGLIVAVKTGTRGKRTTNSKPKEGNCIHVHTHLRRKVQRR